MADTERADTERADTCTERACNEWEKVQKLMQMAEDKLQDKERVDKERVDKERVCTCTEREAQLALQGRIRSIFLIGSKL